VSDLATLTDSDLLRIHAAIKAANKPKPPPEVLTELRDVLAAYPQAWRVSGDLGHGARKLLMSAILPDGMAANMRESILSGLTHQADELRQPTDGPLEHLLIDQVITCWLDDSLMRMAYGSVASTSHSLALGDYWQRKLTMTQKRYLRAIESLAKVRRLMRLTLQINIAEPGSQVVNVAGDLQTGGS
jgi:hypothetical protein